MASREEIRQLIISINERIESGEGDEGGEEFWSDAGAKILLFIDCTVQKSEKVNAMTPKDYSKDDTCLIATIFTILTRMTNVNEPFDNRIWDQRHETVSELDDGEPPIYQTNTISFYELAFSRFCSWIFQTLGDRLIYIQKLLIKNIFGTNEVCSLFASDIYMFIVRLMHPNQKMVMCQLIMNMCRIAPADALVRGASLINRIKHPIVNFENSKYQYLLDFS